MILALAALLGLIFGSFFSAASHRLGTGKKGLLRGRSQCPHCAHALSWYDLIPLLSFLLLRGKCRHCSAPISLRYPLYEFLTAATFALIAYSFPVEPLTLIAHLTFTAVLLFLALHDAAYQDVPDRVSLPAIAAALAYQHSLTSLYGFLALGGFFFLLVFFSRGRAMGGGDIRVGALLGAYLGIASGLTALFLAILLGTCYGIFVLLSRTRKSTALPFVPFLAAGGIIALLHGDAIVRWYLSSFWYF